MTTPGKSTRRKNPRWPRRQSKGPWLREGGYAVEKHFVYRGQGTPLVLRVAGGLRYRGVLAGSDRLLLLAVGGREQRGFAPRCLQRCDDPVAADIACAHHE